jgi:hypothetical protein
LKTAFLSLRSQSNSGFKFQVSNHKKHISKDIRGWHRSEMMIGTDDDDEHCEKNEKSHFGRKNLQTETDNFEA